MTTRIVVIGADGAGMSAASTVKRMRGDDVEVIAFERGEFSSYSACGIPYWIAGDIGDRADLIARSPAQHRANGLDLRMRHLVEGIDTARGDITVRDLQAGT
jgi:NADPH-dependent 2,4-dienoyl-CoA reductase/sulfur reductase-like enzyme